jgi:hypothetical protein
MEGREGDPEINVGVVESLRRTEVVPDHAGDGECLIV